MTLIYKYGRKRSRSFNLQKILFIVSFLATLLVSKNVLAQQGEKKTAAIAAIMFMLMDDDKVQPIPKPDGPSIRIEQGQSILGPYRVLESVFFEFEPEDQDLELCFNIATESMSLPEGTSLEINGNLESITYGENCFVLALNEQRETNYVLLQAGNSNQGMTLSRITLANSAQSALGLRSLTRDAWDDAAVRKVLNVFAFGGHATDTQIQSWATQYPADAIKEMLNFDKHNLKLSPIIEGESYADTTTQHGTLEGFSDFLSNSSSNLPIPIASRAQFKDTSFNFDHSFALMATVRGLNPFRQRIGYWETNYHVAVNADLRPNYRQISKYYDSIMNAHESGVSYEKVMGTAAKSAAIAAQYGHDLNFWREASKRCDCNDDFAREIHQLFFGIFGVDDPNHEEGTIRETAKMLTGMRLNFIQGLGLDDKVTFTTDFHHIDDLTILGATISGPSAVEKIDSLMEVSIQHPESLRNLPIKIIGELADSNLDEAKSNKLRAAWAQMGDNKQFLEFIRAYAISTIFHDQTQRKDLTSFERAAYMVNRFNLDNFETYRAGVYIGDGRAGKDITNLLEDEAAGDIFSPIHNVFGAQTSLEAADSALIFQKNYNFHTDSEARTRLASHCNSCDNGNAWEKKWAQVLPSRGGRHYVEDVAPWLWRHVTGSLVNYTDLEKAYLYAFLGSARRNPGNASDQDRSFDFPLLMCIVEDFQRKVPGADISIDNILSEGIWNNYCIKDDEGGQYTQHELSALSRVYTSAGISNNATIQSLLTQLGQQTLPLTLDGNFNETRRRHFAIERINTTINFIFGTPFVFTAVTQ